MKQSFKLALKSIWGNKVRSFLTMLGIIIGVASVIILVGLVNGQMAYIKNSFADMGMNQMEVSVTNTPSRNVTANGMYDFYREHRDMFREISPKVGVKGTVKYGNEKLKSTNVTGVSEQYLSIIAGKMTAGRFLQYSDIMTRQPVCVLGYYGAVKLFGTPQAAVGQTLKINGENIKIVGVISRINKKELRQGGKDDKVYVPYTKAVLMIKDASISEFLLTVHEVNRAMEAKGVLSDYLKGILKTDDLFYIQVMTELMESMDSTMAMMSATLGGIAGISLLVAGIGVMNIMLVSVTERTREIGIRKSLGAKKAVIMQQFIIEAAVTSSLGGIIGIVLGTSVTATLGSLFKIETVPSVTSILISFGVSVGIGLIFGYLPASRAASLRPIDALRSD